jgi:hypothetical protein
LKRVAIVYGTDGDYIREVLSFFQLRELRRGGDRKYFAVAWAAGGLDRKIWSVNDRFEIEEAISGRPPAFEEAVVLSLPAPAEKPLHKEISALLQKKNVALFNPYPASRKAGDKYFTVSKLAAKNIPVPESILLKKVDSSKIIPRLNAFLARHKGSGFFYVQPNEGTEGRETYHLSSDEFRRSPDFAAEIVSGILRDRDVIVKKARGNVFYFNKTEPEKGYRSAAFRIFLWQPGDEVEAERGFVEISASESDFITSPEKGGRIIAPAEALANLYYRERDAFRRIILTEEEKRVLPLSAARALAAFNSGLKSKLRIAGVDLLLEVTGGKICPVVLEINPRPSGLDKLAEYVPSA